MAWVRIKLRTINPAPARRTSASATSATLHTIEPTLVVAGGGANEIKEPVTTATTFKVESVSGTEIGFSIARNAEGKVTFDCTSKVAGKGGCPKGGDWSK